VIVSVNDCVCEQLVSEGHDESTAPSGNIRPLTGIAGLKLAVLAEPVPKKDITVWIDPLDATQKSTCMPCCVVHYY